MLSYIIIFFLSLSINYSCAEEKKDTIRTGAEQIEKYLPLISNKKVGLVINNTSYAGHVHLVDLLVDRNINVTAIFAPEHGFRGEAEAGETINDNIDTITGINIISLYGKNKKPTPSQLEDTDILIFDIQDVGCRFYTYISTLHYVIEACAENDKPLIILDRPNPNGDYIAGPVLDKKFSSFVGKDPIPVVHGCTIGELALMINGERWHNASGECEIKVIPVEGYSHSSNYSLPVKPSPNLPNDLAVRLYPSLCFFEATSVSIGRGTEYPFQVIGGNKPELGDFTFTPVSIPGEAVNPLNEGIICYGIDLRKIEEVPRFTIKFFLDFYHKYENEKDFLVSENWFNLLAGTDKLLWQIRQGYRETEIIDSWITDLESYKQIRNRYLLYPDFE